MKGAGLDVMFCVRRVHIPHFICVVTVRPGGVSHFQTGSLKQHADESGRVAWFHNIWDLRKYCI